jgi:cytosine/adenosine deaminase-related metal-dependent hydrolase
MPRGLAGVTDIVLANGVLEGQGAIDIAVRDGVIAGIDPAGRAPEAAIDLDGRLVCPALIDGHIHLDKTLLGMPWQPHRPGDTVAARIEAEKRQLAETTASTIERASALVRQVIGFGTTRLRCHVDIDPGCKLANLHAILAVREAFRDAIDIQIVAFPQSGIAAAPGTADLLDAAMREGAEVVGGLDPAGIDDDVEGHLATVFAVAERHGAGIDIHLHDPGALGAFELRRIAERSRAAGMQGKVAVSHAFALGELDADTFARTADALATGGVAIMTNGPGAATIPPILALARHGVLVFAGSDNIRDSWSPYGNGDMLERVGLIGYRARLSTDEDLRFAFALATEHAARATAIAPRSIAVGQPADLVALRAAHVPEAVATRAGERMVFKRGVRVA